MLIGSNSNHLNQRQEARLTHKQLLQLSRNSAAEQKLKVEQITVGVGAVGKSIDASSSQPCIGRVLLLNSKQLRRDLR